MEKDFGFIKGWGGDIRKLAFVVALVALPLAGCSTIEGLIGGGSIAQSNQSEVTTAEKYLTITHLSYDGVGVTLRSEAQSGALHGDAAKQAKVIYDQAGAALDAADQADKVANAQGINAAVAQAAALITQLDTLLHH